ncbi:unnamed protein product [Ixodes hexagonus]
MPWIYVVYIAVFLLYAFVDVNYFIWHLVVIAMYATFRWKRAARCTLFDTDCYTGISFPSDIDHMGHMNNARYIRAFEYARAAFGLRSKLWSTARKLQASILIASQVVRYRKPIGVFQRYRITTRVVFFQGKDLYVEQQLLTTCDNFVRATCVVKLTMTNGGVDDLFKALGLDPSTSPKEMPVEIGDFIAYNEANSSRLNPAKAKGS